MELFAGMINAISKWAIPVLIAGIVAYGYFKRIKVYEVFTEGAKEGFTTAVRIIPYLVAMLVAIGIFRASGAMNLLTSILSPITRLIGMPPETVPMALMRPLSGGGAQGIMTDLFKTYGPDSFIGRVAATMMGSTDTTFYILAVYFGSVGIKNTRHALPAGLVADFVGLVTSVLVCRLVFGA
ncbi:MAG: spore maturation protein [Thermosediminibacteraceae bacterium]|nr:spore maturation protein [Thermosediminibacteraceae bacterium]